MTELNKDMAKDIIIFGAAGDLSRRKLLPALYQLDVAGLLNERCRIIGVARQQFELTEFIAFVTENLNTFVKPINKTILTRFLARIQYVQLDLTDASSYVNLAERLNADAEKVYYFSTAPSLYEAICSGLNTANLVVENSRVVMEKPIGHSLETSKVINDQVASFFTEKQIYRIDHYLGKETVLNLLVLRFANSLFATNWDHNCIEHVQITVAESVGIEGRWGFYDDAGQMKDMVQNHVLQILSLLAMEPPADLSADSIRDEKLKVLKALRPITAANVNLKAVKGQYAHGAIGNKVVPGYLQEEGANTQSTTETFVAIKAEIDNWRWAGVPFYLRTGKRLAKKHSEIVIHFKEQPHNIFKESCPELPANVLTIRLQPEEGVELQVINKVPGIANQLSISETKLDLSFSEAFNNTRVVDAYERLLLEVINGNQSLFVRRDEVEHAWRWVDGILQAWQDVDAKPKLYPAGSWGPDEAETLINQDNRQWDQ